MQPTYMYQIQHVIIIKKKKRGQEWAYDDPTNTDARVNIAGMTCGSKKLVQEKGILVEMIYRECFNDAEIYSIRRRKKKEWGKKKVDVEKNGET